MDRKRNLYQLALAGLLLTTLGACDDVNFTIDTLPRFSNCTGTDPTTNVNNDPQPRMYEDPAIWSTALANWHQVCRPFGQDFISGYDIVHHYQTFDPPKPTWRMFQVIHVETETDINCRGITTREAPVNLVEFWPIPARDMLASYRCCESRFRVVRSSQIGAFDLTDLDTDVQNALAALPVPATNASTIINDPTAFRKLREKMNKDQTLTWNSTYEYDNCSRPPQTACGRRHCLTVHWNTKNGPAGASFAGD
jgi:hypothetical protein